MTGTVLDGNIDVALIKTDGERIETFGAYTLAPYPQSIRILLEEAQRQARTWNFGGPDPAIFGEAEEALTRAQSAAVKELVESSGLTMADIGVVGFHGQTVLHRAPEKDRLGETRQLGDGELMHSLLGTKVVYDFRSADMRAGGQGAPLAAAYHAALLTAQGANGTSPGGTARATSSLSTPARRTPRSTTSSRLWAAAKWTATARWQPQEPSMKRGSRNSCNILIWAGPIRNRSTASISRRRWPTGSAPKMVRPC
jgi:1,6-anhydro-N-acetylmuramate kinase